MCLFEAYLGIIVFDVFVTKIMNKYESTMNATKWSITIHIAIALRPLRIQFSIYQDSLPGFRKSYLQFIGRWDIDVSILQTDHHQYDEEQSSHSEHGWNQCDNPSRCSHAV